MKTIPLALLKKEHYFQLIMNPISSKLMPADKYQQCVARALADVRDSDIDHLVSALLKNEKFKNMLDAYATNVESISSRGIFQTGFSPRKNVNFLVSIMSHEAKRLQSFIDLRNRFEQALVHADYQAADIALNACQLEHGESYWLIRNRTLLLSYQKGDQTIQEYCSSIRKRSKEPFFSTFVDYFQLVSDCDFNDALLIFNNVIHKSVIEFKEASYDEMVSILELMFSPGSLEASHTNIECISLLQAFPLVDQYTLMLEIAQETAIDKFCNGTELAPGLDNFIKLGKGIIFDPLLSRIAELLENKLEARPSEIGTQLLELYENGEYQQAIELFYKKKEEINYPLSYVNLIAKAHAYINSAPSETDKSIIGDLINRLGALYRLQAHHSRAEDEILSRIVRIKGLTQSANVQVALYSVLPQKYHNPRARQAYIKAALVTGEVTPMIAQPLLGASAKDLLGTHCAYQSFADCVPYRATKRKLYEYINAGVEDRKIELLFEEFRKSVPLKKDYFEFYSEYCIAKSKFPQLIKICAEALIEDANLYACFPMEHLIAKIEKTFEPNINSIIVLFHYNKSISQKKDYLLNELFEEFFLSKSVILPSQMLKEMAKLTSAEIAFFRDICNPNIMDFLSCFKSTNELRIERIRILDILFEKGGISDGFRTQEVDELIGQWIVASATNELNGSKIFVDDTALISRLNEEVSSLTILYRQTSEDGDDRITLLGDTDLSSDTQKGYLSGSKNSIALRLIDIHRNAFLFDERFGLDKNLSTEIRHGFFSNLMRSRLQTLHLLTEIGSDGKYASNLYWQRESHWLSSEVWNCVDRHLMEFSAAFNNLVAEAEELMQIQERQEQKDRMLFFDVSTDDIALVRNILEEISDAREISQHIMDILWRRTEECLNEIREYLNGVFRSTLDNIFDDLIRDVTNAKGRAAMINFMRIIMQAKSEIKADITTAAEWFRRASQSSMKPHSLDQVVNIAVNVFNEVTSLGENVNVALPVDFREIYVCGDSVKPFVLAIINLLDNCYRRSGEGANVGIEIFGSSLGSQANVIIKNSVSNDVAGQLTSEYMAQIQSKIESGSGLGLMRIEGGTGLGKASAQLLTVSKGSKLTVDFKDMTFLVAMAYEPPSTIN